MGETIANNKKDMPRKVNVLVSTFIADKITK